MKKYKVNIDRTKPSSEEILSQRNFDELFKHYSAAAPKVIHKPFWKSGWFAGALATAAVVAVTVLVLHNKADVATDHHQPAPVVQNTPDTRHAGTDTTPALVQKRHIAPPLKGLDIAYTGYKVNASRGATITHPGGSKLVIPADAFVDANGNAVSGTVDIRYREFRDPADVFIAGIPMQYDSAGKTYQFESAGMIDIAAFVNGKVVYLRKDKPVEVQLASKENGTQFNLYRFDTTAGNWVYLGKDRVQQPEQSGSKPKGTDVKPLTGQEKQIVSELKSARDKDIADALKQNPVPEQPVVPVKADHRKNRFKVDFSAHEFPEMASYKDVLWQVDESKTVFDRKYMYSNPWESVVVSKGEGKGKYILTFTRGTEVVNCDVFPVFDGKDYDEAVKVYDKKFEEYNSAVARRDAAKDAAESRYEASLAQHGLTPALNRITEINTNPTNDVQQQVMRVFTVSNFGVYNCDSPCNYPHGAMVNASFWDEFGTQISGMSTMYLVDRNRFGLYAYSGNPVGNFEFDPHSSNLVWGVKDGKLYYADQDQFGQLPENGSGEITMKAVGQTFRTPEEMKQFFHIRSNMI